MKTKSDSQRVTFRVQKALVAALDKLLAQIHLRRDSYLNHVLADEVESLAKLKPNSERAKKHLRQLRGAVPDKARIAVTLDADLVTRLNAVCEEKGIVRDAFLEEFIKFLVLGDHDGGSCSSPLVKAAELLGNPRHEYVWDQHPYEELTMTDREVDAVHRLPKDLIRLFEGENNDD